MKIINIYDLEPGGLWTSIPNSAAKGLELFCSPPYSIGHLGVDILHLDKGQAFALHTHPGHHLLLAVKGRGSVTVAGVVYETRPGDLFMIDAMLPHAVGATEDHLLLAFGAPHVHLDDPARMAMA